MLSQHIILHTHTQQQYAYHVKSTMLNCVSTNTGHQQWSQYLATSQGLLEDRHNTMDILCEQANTY